MAARAEMESHAMAHLLGGEGIMADPGTITLRLGGEYSQAQSTAGEFESSVAPEAAALGELPSLLRAGLVADTSWTTRIDRSARPDDEAATLTLATNVRAGVALNAPGADGLTAMLADSAAVYGSAEAAYASMSSSITEIGTTAGALEETLQALESDPSNLLLMLDAAELGNELEAQLNGAATSLDTAEGLLDDVAALARRMGDGHYEIRAGAIARGFVEQRVGIRSPTAQLGANHRLDASVSGHLVVPLPVDEMAGEQLSGLGDLVEVKSSMIALRAYVDVTVEGLDQLTETAAEAKETLGRLRESVEEAATVIGEANDDPASAASDPEFADRAGALSGELEAQGAELSAQLESMTAALDVQTEVGLEVVQATAPVGVGLDEASVRWRYNPNESFELAVRGYVTHVFGSLGAEATRLELDPATGELEPAGTRQVNGYSDFFGRTVGLDTNFTLNQGSTRTTQGMLGLATDGDALAMHLGVAQQIGRFTLRGGVVDPDVTLGEGHRLMPTAGLDIELGRRRQVVLQAGGALDVVPGGGGVEGGRAQLSVTFQRAK